MSAASNCKTYENAGLDYNQCLATLIAQRAKFERLASASELGIADKVHAMAWWM